MKMSPGWVEVMASAGIEAAHRSQFGPAMTPDHEIMRFAELEGYVVFTNDLDFGILLATSNAAKPSVVQVRVGNLRPSLIGSQIIEALRMMRTQLDQGAIVTIDPKRTRVRVLPLR